MEREISIAAFNIEHMPAIATLITELGYPSHLSQIQSRLAKIISHPDFNTLVAESDNKIVGMIGMTKNISYESDGIYVRVLALVTKQEFWKTGVGRKLMGAAENWAREIGADKVLLNCGNREERKAAHEFYKNIGYLPKSTGYVKIL